MDDTAPLHVVGNEYYGDTFKDPKIDGKKVPALLLRDPQNAYDKNAVGVHVGGRQVGSLSAARASAIVRWIEAVGGTLETTLTHRSGGADIVVPASWVAKPEKVTVQLARKYQAELASVGVGQHKAKLAADGEQFDVLVGDVIVGRIFPKKLEPIVFGKIDRSRQQKLVIEQSQFADGLYARIEIPAPKPPASTGPKPALAAPAQPAAPTLPRPTIQLSTEPSPLKSFVRGLFSR